MSKGEVVGLKNPEEYYAGEAAEDEDDGIICRCNPCECETPPEIEEEEEETEKVEKPVEIILDQNGDAYQLDEFMRAKAYFLQTSNKSGLNLYDHLSDVIRKFLDERAPNNPVDYLEEVSMNIKRYRFGIGKMDPLQDAFHISEPILSDAKRVYAYWKAFSRWNEEKKEIEGEGIYMGGSFQNLLRLQYYLEQINIGLPREEMFRVALGIKELSATRPQIAKLRFWGKIFGIQKNYYVIEAEFKFGSAEQTMDLWTPSDDTADKNGQEGQQGIPPGTENILDAVQTFSRAKDVVLNHEFLTAYSKTSGLSPEKQADLLPKPTTFYMPGAPEWGGEGETEMIEFEDPDARADAMKWEGYQQELMDSFPQASGSESSQIPMEPEGSGVNRRAFYVCNVLGGDWLLLPSITPQQINISRNVRWFLTGNLNSEVRTLPPFPGKEGHYLRALLARITAGGMVSPKGYFKAMGPEGELPGEEDDEELEPEDDEPPPYGNDNVLAVKKYQASMKALTNPSLAFWVHHTAYVLPQGRTTWWNPAVPKTGKVKKVSSEDGSDLDEDEDEEDEEEEEIPGREMGPPLFQSITQDKAADGRAPWSLVTSSSVFPEFQVVAIRSNVWSGSNVICTSKGKVSNIYLGDGLKFFPRTFAPPVPPPATKEFRAGPELEETPDPTVEAEQSWLDKLALNAIADVEPKFIDNEEEDVTADEEEEDEDEY
ncbi:unnamed protein product [Orchesella dallaii]|uniref:Radial spoke head protein 6 A n=1 Tax=Orchesella dallaii TaxID=48710 RepID=A0ABP1S3J9_9HEXA